MLHYLQENCAGFFLLFLVCLAHYSTRTTANLKQDPINFVLGCLNLERKQMQAHLKSIEKLLGKLQVAVESDKDCGALWYIPTISCAGQKMMVLLHSKF